jgi:hypothetical protein
MALHWIETYYLSESAQSHADAAFRVMSDLLTTSGILVKNS